MPALQATRIEPVRTLRGDLVKDARPGRARDVLIGVQVFASALLLICAANFMRSAIASSRFNPGFRTADTVLIDTLNEPKRAAMLQGLADDPAITAHAAVRPPLLAPLPQAFADTGACKWRLRLGKKTTRGCLVLRDEPSFQAQSWRVKPLIWRANGSPSRQLAERIR